MLNVTLRACALALPMVVAFPVAAQDSRPAVTATSPDGSIALTVSTDSDSRPVWSLSRKGRAHRTNTMPCSKSSSSGTSERFESDAF